MRKRSATAGSGAYAARPSRGASTTSDSGCSAPSNAPGLSGEGSSRGRERGRGPGADCRTTRRAAASRRSPICSARTPPGTVSHGSTHPPSSTSTCPTPDADSRAAIVAPTRPAPRTCTRIARRAPSSRCAPPGSGCSTESDARSGRSRSRAGPVSRRAAAGSPPPSGSSSSPAADSRSTSESARPSGSPIALAWARSSGRPRVPSSRSRKLPVAVSTGPSTTACAGATPNCTVSRLRQPRRSAGLIIGCMIASPIGRDQHARRGGWPSKVIHRGARLSYK